MKIGKCIDWHIQFRQRQSYYGKRTKKVHSAHARRTVKFIGGGESKESW